MEVNNVNHIRGVWIMTFAVAEIGVNWDGNFEIAKDMMLNAKEIGFNAVKFQAYQETMIKDHPQKVHLLKSTISEDNIETINDLARSIGIEWFCTPMYPEAVELLNPFVGRFKIRLVDGKPMLENKTSKLIDAVLKTNKEIIVSSELSPRGTRFFNHPKVKWLYCVPKYPCELSDLDFRKMGDFSGFSNHSPTVIAPLTSVILGAQILEVHITSNKFKDYVDNNISLDYSDCKELMRSIRLSEQIKKF
jgi:sialic acid synthase SpsE